MAQASAAPARDPRVFIVGIGGPTCSGKTTLTKHILSILRSASASASASASPSTAAPLNTFIVHQDDFAPEESTLVWNDEVQSADWDDPDTSLDWARLQQTMRHVGLRGTLPEDHRSHDELNALPSLPIDEGLRDKWVRQFSEVLASLRQDERSPTHIVFLDGFLLYYNEQVRKHIQAPIFLRIGRDLLKQRRDARGGYVTADGQQWTDPPLYFDRLLWPAHLKAHAPIFQHGDVETGSLLTEQSASNHASRPTLYLLEAQSPPGRGPPRSMDDLLDEACTFIVDALRQKQSQQ